MPETRRARTGYRGVYRGLAGHGGRFYSQRCVDGKSRQLGFFDTAVEAAVAYARSVAKSAEAAVGSRSTPRAATPGLTSRRTPSSLPRQSVTKDPRDYRPKVDRFGNPSAL